MSTPDTDTCPTCGGSGGGEGPRVCLTCGGTGEVEIEDEEEPDDCCSLCHGSGGAPPELPCLSCGGSGTSRFVHRQDDRDWDAEADYRREREFDRAQFSDVGVRADG